MRACLKRATNEKVTQQVCFIELRSLTSYYPSTGAYTHATEQHAVQRVEIQLCIKSSLVA